MAERPVKVRGVCTYKFSRDKCILHTTVSDRLSIAHQAAGAFAGLAVDTIIKQVEKRAEVSGIQKIDSSSFPNRQETGKTDGQLYGEIPPTVMMNKRRDGIFL